VAARQWQHGGGGGQLGNGGSSLAEAQLRWQRQHVGKRGVSVAAAAATRRWQWQHGIGGGIGSGGSMAGSTAAAEEGRDVLAMYWKYFFISFF
jgi:hypothetical protein